MKNDTILLTDLQDLFNNKDKYFVQEAKGHMGVPDDGGGNQGEYNETFKYYKHPGLPTGVFMVETYQSNSYGNNDSLSAISFVKGKEKK